MKKIILVLLLMLPCFVFAKDDVYIESIELYKNDNVEIIKEATVDGLNIDLSLKFHEVSSNIIYKIIIKNDTKEDYEIDDNSIEMSTDYMGYNLSCDNGNIVKHKSDKVCYIKITYKNRVTNKVLKTSSGVVSESQVVNLDLSNIEIVNPKTGIFNASILIVVLLMIGIITYRHFKNKEVIKTFLILFMLLTVLPIKTNALNKVRISINSNIELIGNDRRCSHEIHNIKDYVMCLLETDIYDIHKEELDNRLADPNEEAVFLPSDIEEAKTFMADYDELISNFSWDYNPYYVSEPTSSNYRNYIDGLYLKNRLLFPLTSQAANDDYNNFYDYLASINFDYSKSTYQFSDELKRYFSYNSFHTIKSTSIVRYVKPDEGSSYKKVTFSLIGEPTSPNSMDISIPITYSIATYSDNSKNELEKIDLNIDIQSSIEVRDDGIIAGGMPWNPEPISLTLLGRRRSNLITNIIDLYINHERLLMNPLSLESLISYTNFSVEGSNYLFNDSNGILYNEITGDKKGKEFIEWFDYKFNFYPYYTRYTANKDNEIIKEYCENNNINYKVDTSQNSNQIVFDELPINSYKIVYNGKYYEKAKGLIEFIIDYYNIDTNGFPDNEQAVWNYVWERYKD